MQIQQQRSPIFSDTLVPDLFIRDHCQGLSGDAVKAYLYLLLRVKQGPGRLRSDELAQHFGMTPAKASAALSELMQAKLIELDQQSLVLVDMKERVGAAFFQKKKAEADRPSLAPEELNAREAVLRQINESFFHGLMPSYFYHRIEHYFERYRFDPHVMYTLFGEVSREGKMNGPGYADAVAAAWGNFGVRSFEDLKAYHASREALQAAERMIRQKMNIRQPLTEYQRDLVAEWLAFGYDEALLDEALRRTSQINQPNLNYADKIIRSWHEAGVKRLEDLAAYDEARLRSQPKRRRKSGRQNFPERPFDAARYEAADGMRRLMEEGPADEGSFD